MSRSIYLAGPEVFLPNAKEQGEAKKALCQRYGFSGLYPLDNELDESITSSQYAQALAWAISAGNEQLIQQADVIIANLTPFRGASADVGTVYELGLARGLNKTLLGYSNDPRLFVDRTKALFAPAEPAFDLNGDEIMMDRDGLAIENFELHDNLMIEGGIRLAQGCFLTHETALAERLTDLSAFEALLRWLVEH